ncbi:ABC transporter permease [Pseudohoeflea suaedae]|uniref:ABC transporter permease n=1 Tax=Pseudohoeflea suaedae TaxID=877384 RepID=A0A4R5PPY1_9HYPH|nr:ABC transporter permease [Pseudohoeflea suaedae]TDH38731.1 ABC transporter permease [Pseudohoeflea suaedae]
MASPFAEAIGDFHTALKMRPVWMALAQEDIGEQHRRTTLGPSWLLINYLLLVGTFIVVFGYQTDPRAFARYAASGMLVWLYITDIVTLSTSLFVREASFIKGTRLPFSVYVLRLLMQAIIRFGYMALGWAGIMILTGAPVSPGWLWIVPALAVILLATVPAIIVFAVSGAFFPDLQFIMQNLVRVGMFLTPVFWGMDGRIAGLRGHLYTFNPFTHFLEMFREPVLHGTLPVPSFVICTAITLALWPMALYLLGKTRRQIVFVV